MMSKESSENRKEGRTENKDSEEETSSELKDKENT